MSLRTALLGIAVILVAGSVAILALGDSPWFTVGVGFSSHSPSAPDHWQRRGCAGIRHTPEAYDGFVTSCIGIPFGAWECFVTYPDGGPTHRVPCR